MRMASTPTVMGSTSASDEQVADDSAVAKSSEVETARAKPMEVKEWADSTSLDDVVVDADDWVQLGKTDEPKTRLKSIKGHAPAQLTVLMLKKFCVKHGIGGYKDKSKYLICELIASAAGVAKGLEGKMYPEVNAVKDARKATAGHQNTSTHQYASYLQEMSNAAKERTELFREHNGVLHKMIQQQGADKHVLNVKKHSLQHALDVKRHALAEEDHLFQQLNTQQDSLMKAYHTLADLKNSQNGYDSESMVATDAKEMIDFWRTRCKETMARLNKNSITGVQEAAEEPTRAYKPKEPNLVPKHPPNIFEYIDSSYHSASAPKSPASESSASSSFLPESPMPVVEKQSEKRRKILESSSDDDN